MQLAILVNIALGWNVLYCKCHSFCSPFQLPYFLDLASLLELTRPIRVQISISAPLRVSAPPLNKRSPSEHIDFYENSQEWRVKITFETTTLIKIFTLFVVVFYQIYLLIVYKGQTCFLGNYSVWYFNFHVYIQYSIFEKFVFQCFCKKTKTL